MVEGVMKARCVHCGKVYNAASKNVTSQYSVTSRDNNVNCQKASFVGIDGRGFDVRVHGKESEYIKVHRFPFKSNAKIKSIRGYYRDPLHTAEDKLQILFGYFSRYG